MAWHCDFNPSDWNTNRHTVTNTNTNKKANTNTVTITQGCHSWTWQSGGVTLWLLSPSDWNTNTITNRPANLCILYIVEWQIQIQIYSFVQLLGFFGFSFNKFKILFAVAMPNADRCRQVRIVHLHNVHIVHIVHCTHYACCAYCAHCAFCVLCILCTLRRPDLPDK